MLKKLREVRNLLWLAVLTFYFFYLQNPFSFLVQKIDEGIWVGTVSVSHYTEIEALLTEYSIAPRRTNYLFSSDTSGLDGAIRTRFGLVYNIYKAKICSAALLICSVISQSTFVSWAHYGYPIYQISRGYFLSWKKELLAWGTVKLKPLMIWELPRVGNLH